MDKNTKERIIQENNELKEENERLKALLEEQQLKETNRNLKEENAELKKALNESDYETIDLSMEKEDAEILSLLNRSQKRLEVLESLEKEDKIPSIISKDIHDSSYNISKYLGIKRIWFSYLSKWRRKKIQILPNHTKRKKIEELNEQIAKLNNEIVELTWIDKDFGKAKVKALSKKIDALLDRKYELVELIK